MSNNRLKRKCLLGYERSPARLGYTTARTAAGTAESTVIATPSYHYRRQSRRFKGLAQALDPQVDFVGRAEIEDQNVTIAP
jgi:hypothetical protein